jgi:hypothetical protein
VEIPQRAGNICAPVTFPEGQPQPGPYEARVLYQGAAVAGATFRVTGTLLLVPPPADAPWVQIRTADGQECVPVHELPTVATAVVNCLPDGATFQRLDGPERADGQTWWRLSAGGWVGEERLAGAAGPAPALGLSPEDTVARYYQLLGHKQWGAAYQLLSRPARERLPFYRWKESLASIRDVLTDEIGTPDAAGDLAARYRTVEQSSAGLTMRAWLETWQLVLDDGGWRLAGSRREEVALPVPTPIP